MPLASTSVDPQDTTLSVRELDKLLCIADQSPNFELEGEHDQFVDRKAVLDFARRRGKGLYMCVSSGH